MAARMSTRLRALRTAGDETSHQLLHPSQGRKNLLPIALAFSSWAFDFRCYSNAIRPRSSEPSSRKETPVSLNGARTCSISGDRVSMRSSLDPAELSRFSAIAETWWAMCYFQTEIGVLFHVLPEMDTHCLCSSIVVIWCKKNKS